jgi:predicted phage tail protein
MGAAEQIEIHGEKGGSSKPKSPVEASDSLRSTNLAKLLIAVGEGEFDGIPTDYDIYLDNTPIRDASGNYNFPNVKWDWRPGSVDQTYIPGIPSVENETSLNIELRSDAAWVRSISNIQLSAVRVRLAWPALQRADDEGNIGGYRIEYAIDVATDGGAYQQVLVDAVDGKTTTRYERSRRIDLPEATTGWQIRVRRLTPNQNSNKIADTMLVAGYTEVIDAKLRYPNTALLYIEFDAEQFTNIPAVTVKCKARRWMVPSTYDPVQRTYTGTWDGSMKSAWTNNPAWITYGVCTEDRFGLGKRIKPFMVDKWELYRIAQYCDQLVPNGLGGTEPRFLCDMNLQGKADAWSLLRDISAIYRGMTYWAQGQLVMQADMPRAQDIDYVFTRSNVIDGKFSYGSASAKTRYTRALVSYDNPANNYDTDVIPFADLDLQRRYGDRPTELSAIGCTRASEAQRRGKWAILSNNQDRTVSFKTGMEGVIPLPGHIIPVADSLLAGREVGGRISKAAGRVITLDRDTQAKAGDRLIINLPGGRAEGRTVLSVNGRAVTVTVAYSEPPIAQLQWALDADDLAIPLYRVLRTKRTTEGDFEISALQFEPSKFAYIDTGARLEERPISVIPITVVPAPASVALASTSSIVQGMAVATMTISWPAVDGAVGYDVEWRKDSGNWIKVQRTGLTNVDVVGIYAGAYVARVRAVSAFDITSPWRNSILTNLKGKEGLPPALSYLTATPLLFGIYLKWGFPAGAEDSQRTEIWYGPTTSLEAATKLTDLAYPQSDFSMLGLAAGVTFYFWGRIVDKIGNIGPWYPIGIGVQGQSSSSASDILDMIAGQITETELGKDLLDEIQKIPGIQAQIDALDGLSAYKSDQVYEKDQMVIADGRIFQAKSEVPINTPPPDAGFWLDVGQSIETANGLAQQVAFNTIDITELDGVVTAQATASEALRASARDDNGEGDLAGALKAWASTAAIAAESQVRATETEASARKVETLDAQVGQSAANVSELTQVVATNQSATSTRLETLDARVGQNSANVSSLTQVVVTNQSSTATKIDQLTVSVGQNGSAIQQNGSAIQQNTAAIQQTSTAYADTAGKLSTMWSVKMQVTSNGQYVAAGIGLGIENTGAGLQSQFLVSADRFAIVNTIAGGAISVPFAVQGGQVFMNSAFIMDGAITNAKIGNYISSTNYIAGQQGWILNKDGTLEINGIVPGQGRLVINSLNVSVYDANNVLRVRLGYLG